MYRASSTIVPNMVSHSGFFSLYSLNKEVLKVEGERNQNVGTTSYP